MVYTETHTTGYGSRIGNSIKGILVGILFIIGSIILLWWNEGRTIDVSKGLSEGEKITVSGETSPINTGLEGKLVHINGIATTDEVLKDEIFSISDNAIKLIRNVEMYQWKENTETETKDNFGGSETTTTTYTYTKAWNNNKIDSSSFKESGHNNPTKWQFESQETVAQNTNVGDLKLSSPFVNQLNNKTSIEINEESFNDFVKNNDIKNAINENNIIYIGSGATTPQIGDLKISFSAVYPEQISAIGQQSGNTLVSYKTKTDTNINLLQYGTVTIEKMYEKANSDNMLMAWIIRAVGLLIMFIGFKLLFGLIVTLAKVIPFISSILGIGVGLIAFVLTLIFGGGTIIIAWLFVRPLISISLLILIVGIIFLIKKYKIKKS